MKPKIGGIPFDETKKVELKKMPRLTLVKPGDGNDPNHSKPGRAIIGKWDKPMLSPTQLN